MSKKITITGNALIITDTVSSIIEFEAPRKDCYFDYRKLNDGIVKIYDLNSVNMGASGVSEHLLSICVDSGLIAFTDATFRTFARTNLGG